MFGHLARYSLATNCLLECFQAPLPACSPKQRNSKQQEQQTNSLTTTTNKNLNNYYNNTNIYNNQNIIYFCRRSSFRPRTVSAWTGSAARRGSRSTSSAALGKGQMGSALTGSLHFLCFLTGNFWVLLLTYLFLPRKCQCLPFSPILQNKWLLQRPHQC